MNLCEDHPFYTNSFVAKCCENATEDFLFIQEKPFQHGITSVGHCYFQSVLQYFEKCCEQFQPCFPPWNVY